MKIEIKKKKKKRKKSKVIKEIGFWNLTGSHSPPRKQLQFCQMFIIDSSGSILRCLWIPEIVSYST